MNKNALFTIVVVLFASVFAFSQETVINNGSNNSSTVISEVITPPQRVKSQEEISIIQQMRQLRRSGTATPEKLLELQKRLDAVGKETVTQPFTYYPGGGEYAKPEPPFITPDVIGNTLIFSRPNIKSIATATETNGPTAGRIWAVILFSGTGTPANPDSIRVFYSTNHGASWVLFNAWWLGATDKFNYDDLDIEIIENTNNGEKYLYCVWGVRSNGGSGDWFTGGMCHRISGVVSSSMWSFNWPGGTLSTNRYYNIRITTDEFLFLPQQGYLYIVCSYDSNKANGFKRINQRFAYCLNPYTTNPTFVYRLNDITTDTSTVYPQPSAPNLNTDIAYFYHNFQDSLIVSFSNLTDSTALQFTKMDEIGNTGLVYKVKPTLYPNDIKTNLRVASNSNDNGFISCAYNQFHNGKSTVVHVATNNWGDFRMPQFYTLWSGNFGASKVNPMGFKIGTAHALSFVKRGISHDSIVYFVTRSNPAGYFLWCQQMNHSSNWWLSDYFAPAIGVRYVNYDSCFVLYSDINQSQVWAAYGCYGSITEIKNNEQPAKYNLYQNYPNPFNPVTQIRYEIPKQELVSLKVFDLLGREVATLVNEVKQAGIYTYDFNGSDLSSGVYYYKIKAGDFSDVKRMILIK
jgi:hypothetical protein